jgi:hypothetical protein
MSWESAERIARNINTDGAGTPGIWDVVYFAGKPCVGIAEVTLTLGAEIDKRRKKGQKKSKPIDCGAKPAELGIDLTLHAGQFDAFMSDVAPLLFSLSKTEAQNPIGIGHPSLEPWGLNLFVIQSVSMPHPSKGLLKVSIKAVEWLPEPPAISSKQKAINDLADKANAALSPLLALAGGGRPQTVEDATKNAIAKFFP